MQEKQPHEIAEDTLDQEKIVFLTGAADPFAPANTDRRFQPISNRPSDNDYQADLRAWEEKMLPIAKAQQPSNYCKDCQHHYRAGLAQRRVCHSPSVFINNLVTGPQRAKCEDERNNKLGACGPAGLLFLAKVDGVSSELNG